MSSCCTIESQIFTDWIIPEGIVQRSLGEFYKKNPVMSRLIATPIALCSGIVKVFLFPLICLVGVVVMPIIAFIRAYQEKQDGGHWLKAWCFCILGVAGTLAFLGVTCYYLPLVTSSALLVTLMAFSIIVHVHKLVKEPIEPSPFSRVEA